MPDQFVRRDILKALPLTIAGLALTHKKAGSQDNPISSGNSLVAYYSRTGNTAVIARQIKRAQAATLFEIKTRTPYPEDYEATVRQAQQETKSGSLPPSAHFVADIGQYDTIYLGFPIWGMTAPPVIRSFLRAHDLSGKIVKPFITHGGYGLGNSMEIVSLLAPDADLRDALTIEADQERRTLQQVTGWLGG